ncbi:MAG: beta-ketoacyl-ACP synthase III [Rhodothermaceae bacterium]
METNNKTVNATITGTGMYLPEKVLDNKYFEQIVDTSDEWIMTRTGIKERRMLEEGGTSVLATNAVNDLLKNTNTNPEEIDVIIVCTITPDYSFPSTSCLVQNNIGAKNAWAFDLSAACSGFLFGLQTGASLVKSGHKKVVVVGADKMSDIVDYTDRNTCVLFGDAGAAVMLEPTEDLEYGIHDSILKSDGSGKDYLIRKAGGSALPTSVETLEQRLGFVHQEGKTVYKYAVSGMAGVALEIVERNKLTGDDIAHLVPHQANIRIIEATAKRVGIPMERVMLNIQNYGNTTAATIPLCLAEANKAGKLKKGEKLVLAAFGGGFTWGSILLTWS